MQTFNETERSRQKVILWSTIANIIMKVHLRLRGQYWLVSIGLRLFSRLWNRNESGKAAYVC